MRRELEKGFWVWTINSNTRTIVPSRFWTALRCNMRSDRGQFWRPAPVTASRLHLAINRRGWEQRGRTWTRSGGKGSTEHQIVPETDKHVGLSTSRNSKSDHGAVKDHPINAVIGIDSVDSKFVFPWITHGDRTTAQFVICMLLSLAFALCLASSDAVGLLKRALRPPATLLGFLSSADLDAASTSPPLSAFSGTPHECCLDSSNVSTRH